MAHADGAQPHTPDWSDAIVLVALGEPAPDGFVEHRAACPDCRTELAALQRTVLLARDAPEEPGQADPPHRVWTAIAEETGTEQAPSRQRRRTTTRHQVLLRGAAAVVALVLVCAAAAGGYLAGRQHGSPAGSSTAAPAAHLHPMPGGPMSATGKASIRSTSAGRQLRVQAAGLPLTDGYYEVWLFDARRNIMVAVGTLGPTGAGAFPVPASVDLSAFSTVDVSAQRLNGNPAHAQSVLRGALSR